MPDDASEMELKSYCYLSDIRRCDIAHVMAYRAQGKFESIGELDIRRVWALFGSLVPKIVS